MNYLSIAGRALVMAGLLAASAGSVVAFGAGARSSEQAWRWAEKAVYVFAGCMIAANVLMDYAIVTHDFSIQYVTEVGSLSTPTYYAVASLWSALNGSILFWGGILGLYAAVFVASNRNDHREYMPWATGVLLAVGVFFSFLIASIANPFADVPVPPVDGPGPNPLLQNHPLIAFHPPALYGGYVGMAVPFSMCAAALLAGRLEAGWIAPLRKWTLVPWTLLTIGITMGGWWSYEVLGWGGYWAWDPVENASFMPWLTATALLHSAMVLERRGQMKTWTLILGFSTFLLTLLGTFMTRSGVFNSVHSFTQSDIGPTFLVFIGICFVFSVALLALREHTMVEKAPPGAQGLASSPLSREFMMLIQNIAFTTFAFTVLVGVLFPLISEEVSGKKVSVGGPYFNRMALPIGCLIVFLMGVGPVIPWGRSSSASAGRRLGLPFGAAVITGVVAFAFGVTTPYTLLALAVCAFALWANASEFFEPVMARVRGKGEGFVSAVGTVLRRSRRRTGGHVAHLGIVLAVVSIAMSSTYKYEKDFFLKTGDQATIGAFTATYRGAHMEKEARRDSLKVNFDVSEDGKDRGAIDPRLNYYKTMVEPVGTPAVLHTATMDFYVSIMQVAPDGSTVSVRMMTMPLVQYLWLSCIIIACGTVLAVWPSRQPRALVAPAPAGPAPVAS